MIGPTLHRVAIPRGAVPTVAAIAFLGATLWQFALPNRAFFGIVSAEERNFQLAEVLGPGEAPAREAEPATEEKTSETATRVSGDSSIL